MIVQRKRRQPPSGLCRARVARTERAVEASRPEEGQRKRLLVVLVLVVCTWSCLSGVINRFHHSPVPEHVRAELRDPRDGHVARDDQAECGARRHRTTEAKTT